MTAINAWAGKDSATVYTDAAWIDGDGKLIFVAPKALPLAHMSAALVVRGSSHQVRAMESYFPSVFTSVDHAFANFSEAMEKVPPPYADSIGPQSMGSWQAVLVGYSDALERFVGVFFRGTKGGLEAGWTTQPFERFLTPESEAFQASVSGIDSDPGPDAAADIMERQRALVGPVNGVEGNPVVHVTGGFCLRTHITREGISTTIIRRWPDRIGEPLAQRAKAKGSARDPFRATASGIPAFG
ncbi:hypothetical protein MKK58_00340 [Methylobacterium sp. J-078]|uniref:hypothetical protein n=1 Tax=Methylobacterium sp. J-078 TaxID=2836657 RepID=UPI001FBB1DCA|nr:hypothetical protein [Methylobacterium sp. J-078]MCJ2043008.1 hypothetical protein [Methylobacterium sp. J-078]